MHRRAMGHGSAQLQRACAQYGQQLHAHAEGGCCGQCGGGRRGVSRAGAAQLPAWCGLAHFGHPCMQPPAPHPVLPPPDPHTQKLAFNSAWQGSSPCPTCSCAAALTTCTLPQSKSRPGCGPTAPRAQRSPSRGSSSLPSRRCPPLCSLPSSSGARLQAMQPPAAPTACPRTDASATAAPRVWEVSGPNSLAAACYLQSTGLAS